jgi:hypothetical protein
MLTMMTGALLTINATTTNMTVPNEALGSTDGKKDCSSINEPDDDFYCDEFDWGAYTPDRQSVEELCDASEDYAKNPKHCDIAYDLVEKQDKNLKKDLEEACDKAGGKMENGYCDVNVNVKEKQQTEQEEQEQDRRIKKKN